MICKKCGIDGNFAWDRDWFDNTGKWRLFDHNMERPHECSHTNTQASVEEPIQTQPRVKCPQCDPLKDSAWIAREKLQEHIKTAHFGFW
jgi:hypothetical protein